MIDNLSDTEILNYLLTSEFNDGLTPDEFRFLLYQFRNYYRVVAGKNDVLRGQVEIKARELDETLRSNSETVNRILSEKADLENKLSSFRNRDLSWKERWTGKLIIENETK